jgi:hypothetical protein
MTTIPYVLAGHQQPIDHYADLIEQLFREYEAVLSLSGIVALVNQCRHDLAGSPVTAMPELLERLARCRLSTLAEEHGARGNQRGTGAEAAPVSEVGWTSN